MEKVTTGERHVRVQGPGKSDKPEKSVPVLTWTVYALIRHWAYLGEEIC